MAFLYVLGGISAYLFVGILLAPLLRRWLKVVYISREGEDEDAALGRTALLWPGDLVMAMALGFSMLIDRIIDELTCGRGVKALGRFIRRGKELRKQ